MLVIIMSALLVLALIAVVWGMVRQTRILLGGRQTAPAAAGTAARIVLAPGARIVSAQTEAGRLVLHLTTPAGEEVEIIDLASGKLIQQIKTPK
jgi:hypothetical protein